MIDSKIILGSKSPRRKELLEGLGYSFEIRTKDTDESYPLTIPSLEVAKFIALQKANALISDLKSNEIHSIKYSAILNKADSQPSTRGPSWSE